MSEVKATVSLPIALARQVQGQIQAGWFPDLDSQVVEALRRYLESHRDELMEHSINHLIVIYLFVAKKYRLS